MSRRDRKAATGLPYKMKRGKHIQQTQANTELTCVIDNGKKGPNAK